MSDMTIFLIGGGIAGAFLIDHLCNRKHTEHMMMDEWRARMKKLNTEKPVMSRIEGKPGVSSSIKARKRDLIRN